MDELKYSASAKTPPPRGLSTAEALAQTRKHGQNRLPEAKKHALLTFLRWIFSPVSLMLIAAAGLSAYIGKETDAYIIAVLFLSNFGISAWHEHKADRSIQTLQKTLVFGVRTLRDGAWKIVESPQLVVDDIVELTVGSVVSADMALITEENLSINESPLTGESLPRQKKAGETAYAGSFVTTGSGVGRVSAIGAETFFGKTVSLIDMRPKQSALEKDIISIATGISAVSISIVVLLTAELLQAHTPITEVLTLALSVLIAGIPVALPTVMSLIISVGVYELAKKQVIVRRLASLEDLANVDLLLSDKTGTLTENNIAVTRVVTFSTYTENEVLALARSAVLEEKSNPIDRAVVNKAEALAVKSYPKERYTPGDSERKRSTAIVTIAGKVATVSLGAPQVLLSLAKISEYDRTMFEHEVTAAAESGYRTLAVAVNPSGGEEAAMTLCGLLLLADTLRPEAKSTVRFMQNQGIEVKMVTGDSLAISTRIAKELDLVGTIDGRTMLDIDGEALAQSFPHSAGYAEVLPKDKYLLVVLAQKSHVVAVTGDGINDLPAVKAANVGFAVSNAVDALKSSADIVLLSPGISVIRDAIIEAQKIFARLYNYSIYRISESFRIIITIAVIGIIYHTYPLTPVQLILLALLNDVPIVSLAFDRVKNFSRPAHTNTKRRFALSSILGLVGVANSLLLLFVMLNILRLPWAVIQTVFFLKLTISGHMLIYLAHTEERWYRYLPSKQVLIATIGTQLLATLLAYTGLFVTPIPIGLIALVWTWSFFWMQVGDLLKSVAYRL